MKIGTIYADVARRYLARWHSEMSLAEREALIGRGNIDEIESIIGAKPYIATSINSLRSNLEQYSIALPSNFLAITLYSTIPNSGIDSLCAEIVHRSLSLDQEGDITIQMLKAIHDEWVRRNPHRFFQDERKRYMFNPVELIGLEELSKDYIFVLPITDALGLTVNTSTIIKKYQAAQKSWLIANEVSDRHGLERAISVAFYPPLTSDIIDYLRYSPETVRRIADQVMYRSPKLIPT